LFKRPLGFGFKTSILNASLVRTKTNWL